MSSVASSSATTASNKGLFQIPLFDGTHAKWPLWKQRVKAAMKARQWWSYLDQPHRPSTSTATASSSSSPPSNELVGFEDHARACALSALLQSLPDELMAAYAPENITDPSIVWTNLISHFESNSRMNRSHLRNKLASTRMSTSTTYLTYYTELMTIVRSLIGMGEVVSDSEVMHHILNGLSPDYENIKLILQTNDMITMQTMHRMLTQHAERLQIGKQESKLDQDNASLYFSGSRNSTRPDRREQRRSKSSKVCFTCKQPGHIAYDCERNINAVKCGYCKYVDSHTEDACQRKQRDEAAKNGQKPSQSRQKQTTASQPQQRRAVQFAAEDSDSSEDLFFIGDEEPEPDSDTADDSAQTALHAISTESFSRASSSNKAPRSPNSIRLTLDSGATIATARKLEHLHAVRKVKPVRVRVANNQTIELDRVGALRVRTADGSKTLTIPDVYYWPGCPVNLISVSSLTRNAKEVLFSTDEAIIRKVPGNGEPILRIPKRGNLYVIDLVAVPGNPEANCTSQVTPSESEAHTLSVLPTPIERSTAANSSTPLQLWHNRLGHLGRKTLKNLIRSPCVRGLESLQGAAIEDHVCHGCAVGKTTRKAFSRLNSGEPASEILDRMHADVKGPINVPTHGGKRYLLCLTDEKARRTWGFLLKKKSEAPQIIMNLLTQLRVETGKTLRVFHSDNGGEFVNQILHDYFEREGIKFSTTTSGTPNHNPIAERAFRTIFNTIRAMLHHAELPPGFWGHAAITAIHLKNKTTTSAEGLTPEAIWNQQAHELNHRHRSAAASSSTQVTNRFTSEMKNLRVFGCNAYYHLQERKPLEARANKAVFLGYADEGRGYYYLLDLASKKLVKRRDVQFDEDQFTFARELAVRAEPSNGGSASALRLHSLDNPHGAPAETLGITSSTAAGTQNTVSVTADPLRSPHVSDANQSMARSMDPVLESSSDEEEAEAEVESGGRQNSGAPQAGPGQSLAGDTPPVTCSDIPTVGPSTASAAPQAKRKRTLFESELRQKNILSYGRQRPEIDYSLARKQTKTRSSSTPRVFAVESGAQDADSLASMSADGSGDEIEDPEPDFTPSTWKQAMSCRNARHWYRAAEDEIKGMQMSQSYELVPRPVGPNANVIDSKWVWKKKLDRWGRVQRFRARLVARGFKQVEGVDYFETFAPVMRYKSLLILLHIAAKRNYEIRHLDVPKAFLQAALGEAIYMEQPEGFQQKDGHWVWKLLKSVYGIKQAPNNWNDELNRTLLSLGFIRLKTDSCVYVKRSSSGQLIILGVFVDDIIPMFSSTDGAEWAKILRALQTKYNIKDTGDASVVLGIRLTRNRGERTIKLDHVPYIAKMLKDFRMGECNPASTPMASHILSKADCPEPSQGSVSPDRSLYQRLVGSLNYAAISVRPDIAFAVNTLARFMQNPGATHLTAAKRVLRYLKGTAEVGLVLGNHGSQYHTSMKSMVTMWSDSDYATNPDDRRSVTGYIVQVQGSVVSWSSKQQRVTAKSSCEAEYYAISDAVSDAKWVTMLVREVLVHETSDPRQLSCFTVTGRVDNTAAIAISKNDAHHSRTKHIDLRHHHVREAIDKNQLVLEHVPSKEQLADILTKSLGRVQFEQLRSSIMS